MTMPVPAGDDPVSALVKSRGFALRVTALALSILSVLLPAISGNFLGMGGSVAITAHAPWAFILPLVALVAFVSPAVTPISRYGRLLDIAVAIVATIVAVYLLSIFIQAASQLERVNREVPEGMTRAFVSLGIGAYALFATVAVAAVQVFRR